jgi:hypothetical protein
MRMSTITIAMAASGLNTSYIIDGEESEMRVHRFSSFKVRFISILWIV